MIKIGIFLDKFLNKPTSLQSFYFKDGDRYCLHTHNKLPKKSKTSYIAYSSWVDWSQGVFVNLSEFEEIPKLDLDVIFLTLEWHIHKIDDIRKAYPNAVLCAVIRELYFISSLQDRIDFFNKCDRVFSHCKHTDITFGNKALVNKDIEWLPCPIDIDAFTERFQKQNQKNSFVMYLPNHPPRRHKTEEFVKSMSKKYDIPYVQFTASNHDDFLELVSQYKYLINLDPEPQFGQLAIYNASYKTLNIGGLCDAHKVLYPKTANIDTDYLESILKQCVSDNKLFSSLTDDAYNTAQATYSYKSVHNRFLDLIKTPPQKFKMKSKVFVSSLARSSINNSIKIVQK